MRSLIEVENITVRKQNKLILKEVSLSIQPNDFLTVIGPNGAGKSTLLKCLMGVYKPDIGSVYQKRGLKIGYVPQQFMPDRTMPITVKRFLTLRKKSNVIQLENIIQETGVGSILETALYALSGGELQRVLLARSLLDEPDLLILDEPAQNLDIAGQLYFYNLLNRIYTTRELTILMVSHDLYMVMQSTKKVICLYHHICCSGTPHAVARDPEFIALFGKDMANMMAVYQHSQDHHLHSKEHSDV